MDKSAMKANLLDNGYMMSSVVTVDFVFWMYDPILTLSALTA